ncbi:MAG: hypothetical protein NDI84_03055 [Steroidobacteraceae bacterium]|nr:hypothetical protein [Steroidobacteraceae bacterium]
MSELVALAGSDGPLPVALVALSPMLETELNASVVAAGGSAVAAGVPGVSVAMTAGGVGISGAAAGAALEIELNAGTDAAGDAAAGTEPAAAGAAVEAVPGWAGRLEMDVNPWAPAVAAAVSCIVASKAVASVRIFIGRRL